MKIAFLCGGLEPGRDGVGDYTRRLAGELIRQGHDATIVALTDPHVTAKTISNQDADGIDLAVLRIPVFANNKDRCIYLEKWIMDNNPAWLSLQYVPFAFHSKGLPFGLSKLLRKVSKGRNWHIMFHELWVGIEFGSNWKHIGWGFIQRILIQTLIKNLQPQVIHTQTQTYYLILHKLGINAKHLPLFSNIPPLSIKNREMELTEKAKQMHISLVMFGPIHPDTPANEFVKEIVEYRDLKNISISLTFIGRSGAEKQLWDDACKNEGLETKSFGEQSPQRISEELHTATIGISTTPLALAEKSGTVAAMFAHGLQVICVTKPWKAKGIKPISPVSGLIEYRKGNVETCLTYTAQSSINSVFDITRKLVESLTPNSLN